MKILLDTNVLVAAFVARGHCHELLEHLIRTHDLFVSEHILAELRRTLVGKIGMPEALAQAAEELLRSRARIVAADPSPEPVSRDPDDDPVLAAAVAAGAECLITGDDDLLVLGEHAGITIVRPRDFWDLEGGDPSTEPTVQEPGSDRERD